MAMMVLAARLDLTAARPLTDALLAHAGSDLTVDAGRVEHLGGLAVQALLAAAQRWRDDGCALAVWPRSAAFDDALARFGLTDAVPGQGAPAWA
ncbi:STAS domain-containing protein [Paracoccus luteus]|uniref:STAS domain-containing protein n=1 Tax=Paracoccus luteus TaxID=2508543 RepID=UPI0014308755|nr:STAS domain-containing protein [Paracoccus luteus]